MSVSTDHAGGTGTQTAGNRVITDRAIGAVLTVGGLIGALAALVLAIEKINLLQDPAYVPTCSINPILSCGSIMASWQAETFGFANPLIGLAAFPVVATTGVAVLARLPLPRWWWWGLQAGALFGIGFVHWLFLQSVYRIGALCPYCMVVWVVMIALFTYITLYNLERGHLLTSGSPAGAIVRVHTAVPVLWILILAAMIGIEFWNYWRTLI